MKFSALLAIATLIPAFSVQAKPKAAAQLPAKPAAKAKPAPTGAPPGYEVAKFFLPPAPYRTGPVSPLWAAERRKSRRGPVYLPKGSSNVALHKPVASSDEAPIIGELSSVTNGEKGAEAGQWVELGPGTQWVQIDLKKSFDIHGLLLWHYHDEPRVYRDVVIQLADDPDFLKNVRTVFNNDHDNSSGLGKGADKEYSEDHWGQWIPFKTQPARYVRLYSRGNTSDPQNQYIEVEVWANSVKTAVKATVKPSKTALKGPAPDYEIAKFVLPTPTYSFRPLPMRPTTALPFERRGPVYLPKGSANVALGKKATSSDEAPIIGDLTLITDGEKDVEEGHWVEFGPGTQWVQIDLEKLFDIHGVLLWHYHGEERIYRDVVIRLADDAAFTKNVRTIYNNDHDNSSGFGPGQEREYYEHRQGQWISFETQRARFVRLYSRGNTSDLQNQYIEAEVWATSAK